MEPTRPCWEAGTETRSHQRAPTSARLHANPLPRPEKGQGMAFMHGLRTPNLGMPTEITPKGLFLTSQMGFPALPRVWGSSPRAG